LAIKCLVTENKHSRKDIYKERLEVYNRESHLIGRARTTVAGLSAVHLLSKTKKGAPCPVGTGVLFKNGDKLFILTAAHVAEEFSDGKSAYINLPNQLIEISGQVHASGAEIPRHDTYPCILFLKCIRYHVAVSCSGSVGVLF
jgi:hypothetical protein